MIESIIEIETKKDVLKEVGLGELPDEFDESSGKVWGEAIGYAVKSDGSRSYIIVRNNGCGGYVVYRNFGNSALISRIEHIYPTVYLSNANMSTLKNKKSIIGFLHSHGEDSDAMDALLSKKKSDGSSKSEEEANKDHNRIVGLVIWYSVDDIHKMRAMEELNI